MPEILRLSSAQLDEIIRHARAHVPEEACGILAGTASGDVKKVYLMENTEHSPTFYLMDSREQFQVFDDMEKQGLELVAIFHSHPDTEAYPSARDCELAFYPDSLYMIVSLAADEPSSRVFKISDSGISETEIILDETEAPEETEAKDEHEGV